MCFLSNVNELLLIFVITGVLFTQIQQFRMHRKRQGPAQGETALGIQTVEDEGFDFYARPASKDLDLFFSYHPQQPPRKGMSVFQTKDGIKRKTLTYCEKENSQYCTVCLAYAKPSASESAFVKGGMNAWKHVHQRIEEHERNQVHRDSAEAYFMKANQADIASLLGGKQMSLELVIMNRSEKKGKSWAVS